MLSDSVDNTSPVTEQKEYAGVRPATAAGWFVVAVATIGWTLLVIDLALAMYNSFHYVGNDLGLYNQVFWTTTHTDRWFYSSRIPGTDNYLAHHFSPILGALLPFYLLWPDARVFLIVQVVALALGALPLFAFARRRLSLWTASLVVVAYVLSPFLAFIAFADFHEIALAVPLLMAAGAALLDHRPRRMLIWLGLALLVKEEVAIIAVGFGVYALFMQRRVRLGVFVTSGALAYAGFVIGVIMPALGQDAGQYPFLSRYASLGETPGAIVQTVLTHPRTVASVLTEDAKLIFIVDLLLPVAGLPLLGMPALLLAAPTAAYLLLSDYSLHFDITSYYTAPLLPFLFLSSVIALGRLRRRHRWLGYAGVTLLLAAALFGAHRLSPLPGGANYEPARFEERPEHRTTQAALAHIPTTATVRADWRYFPMLGHVARYGDALHPSPYETAPDYIVLSPRAPDAILPPTTPHLLPSTPRQDAGYIRKPRYALRVELPDGTQILERRPPNEDVQLAPVHARFERGLVLVAAGIPPEAPDSGSTTAVNPGTTVPIWLAWEATTPIDVRLTFTVQLLRGDERVAQVDKEVGHGRHPTTLWHEWVQEPIVVDSFPLHIPRDVPAGTYRMVAGVYESERVTPLRRSTGDIWVQLATVMVE